MAEHTEEGEQPESEAESFSEERHMAASETSWLLQTLKGEKKAVNFCRYRPLVTPLWYAKIYLWKVQELESWMTGTDVTRNSHWRDQRH